MREITEGEPQPVPCLRCGYSGYMVTELVQRYLDTHFDKNGNYQTVVYSDHEKTIRKLKRANCSICLKSLPFTIKP